MRLPDLDPRIGHNFIDGNVLDRTSGPEDAAVDRILQLHDDEAFTLLLPHSVKTEIAHPHTPAQVKNRAAHMIYSMPVELTASELATHDDIRAMIQGNAKPGRHDRDAFHLVESSKYGRIFITNDGRLLKKSAEIWQIVRRQLFLRPDD